LTLVSFPPLWCLALALSLVFSSLNSKAMGLSWLLLVLAGFFVTFQNLRQPHRMADCPWAKTWLVVAAFALTIKAIPVWYWSDPWSERHGELRLFFGACALYGLIGYKNLARNTLVMLAHALCISSAFGLSWVLLHGRDALPSHPIPWAGGMAMISALLLALSLKSDFSQTHRRLWFFGGLLAVMAVLASQSRGAYGIVFWWLAVGLHHLWAHRQNLQGPNGLRHFTPRRLTFVAVILLCLASLSQTPVFQRPAQSLQDAVNEIRVSSQSTAEGANSSVGARLYMWQNSLVAIKQSPWIGHGHDTRKELLRQWAEAAHSDEIKRLGHVHNEYLHQLIDHGLWGLGSQLVYLGGLLLICWQMQQKGYKTAALSLAGMVFIHFTVSLSNVNFAHNYYTISLSLFVGLSLWLSRLELAKPKP
jgi:O-antigen ligase